MLVVAKDLQTQYEKALDSASISRELRKQLRSEDALARRVVRELVDGWT
jgi:hypothetical protein